MILPSQANILIVSLLLASSTQRILSASDSDEASHYAPIKYTFHGAPTDPEFYKSELSNKIKKLASMGITWNGLGKAHNTEMIEKKGKLLQRLQKEANNTGVIFESMTNEKYFRTKAVDISCIDHMKMMGLGFTCMDTNSIAPEDRNLIEADEIKDARFTSIYVVSRNSKKYFMVILDDDYDLELGIYMFYKENNISLDLIEYKIVNSRFVGIYSYFPHQNTLRHQIMEEDLTTYEKLFIMKQMTKIAMDFFNTFEPRNNLLKLNLLPANLMVTRESFFKLRLIRFIRGSRTEKDLTIVPESIDMTNKLNQRSSIVYVLGKIFYFITFKTYSFAKEIDEDKYMKEFNRTFKIEEFPDIDPDLMDLMRGMMNRSPVDRPSLEYAYNKLKDLERDANTLYYTMKKSMFDFSFTMENEIRKEYSLFEESVRTKVKEANLEDPTKNSIMIRSKWKNEKEKSDKLRRDYLLFTGRSMKCGLSHTKSQINFLDDYGLFPIESKEIQSIKVLLHEPGIPEQLKHEEEEHHEDLNELRIEFVLLIVFLLLLIAIVSTYFALKDKEIVMYMKNDFPAKLIL